MLFTRLILQYQPLFSLLCQELLTPEQVQSSQKVPMDYLMGINASKDIQWHMLLKRAL